MSEDWPDPTAQVPEQKNEDLARIMAASPDLLAACQAALAWILGDAKTQNGEMVRVMAKLIQAVEKATGEEWMPPR